MASFLSKITDKLERTDAEQGMRRNQRARVADAPATPGSFPTFHSLMSCLLRARDKVLLSRKSSDWPNIEIERRLGMIIRGNRRWQSLKSTCYPGTKDSAAFIVDEDAKRANDVNFEVGIDQSHAERLPGIFSPEKFEITSTTEQLVRISGEKVRFDATGDKPVRFLEEKTKLIRSDIALYAYHYDVRIDCCLEQPLDGEVPPSAQSSWEMERLKRRTSYRSRAPG
jgi:hypothetical protein